MSQSNSDNPQDYKPLYNINQRTNQANSAELRGTKTGRVHHLVGKPEIYCFFCFEWSPVVVDICEQFALDPLEETLDIAHDYGLKHPTTERAKKIRQIATTFLLKIKRGPHIETQARTVRSEKALRSPGVIEEVEIEYRYWQARHVDWALYTENDYPEVFARNVDFILGYLDISHKLALDETTLQKVEDMLILTLAQMEGVVINDIVTECDAKLRLQPPTSLITLYHLLAQRRLRVDMNESIKPHETKVYLSRYLK